MHFQCKQFCRNARFEFILIVGEEWEWSRTTVQALQLYIGTIVSRWTPIFRPKFFGKNFFGQKFFGQNFFGAKFFLKNFCGCRRRRFFGQPYPRSGLPGGVQGGREPPPVRYDLGRTVGCNSCWLIFLHSLTLCFASLDLFCFAHGQ